MKNKNIYFVGYFQNIKDKMKFVDLFDCKKKFFLEASIDTNISSDIQYFPEQIYRHKVKTKHLLKFEKTIVDSFFKKLYRRDFKHFKSLSINMNKISKYKKILLVLLFSIKKFSNKNKRKTNFNIFKWFTLFIRLMKLYINNDLVFLKEFKIFMFRTNFILGYRYSKNILETLPYKEDDFFVMWGKSYTSRILLLSYLDKYQIPYIITEYGEIPGTMSCSTNGIFGEIFTKKSWKELHEKEITKSDMEYTIQILNQIQEAQISTRSYDDNMYFLMKYFYENSIKKEHTKKVIYVNGAELFSSALYWNRWNIGYNGKNPNKMLLEKVVSFFNKDEYMILYKEHPMTINQSKNSLLSSSDFPSVNFINSMNIHDVIDLADIIITFPSKVVMTSLIYGKTTFVLGDFTIPYSIPSIKYYTSRDFQDIKEIYTDVDYDKMEFIKLVAGLIKYSLIVYDEKLHYKYNRETEQKKLNDIITEAFTQKTLP